MSNSKWWTIIFEDVWMKPIVICRESVRAPSVKEAIQIFFEEYDSAGVGRITEIVLDDTKESVRLPAREVFKKIRIDVRFKKNRATQQEREEWELCNRAPWNGRGPVIIPRMDSDGYFRDYLKKIHPDITKEQLYPTERSYRGRCCY